MGLILLIILILLLIGAVPSWPYSRNWGYWPSGGLGLIVVIVLILLLPGRYYVVPSISNIDGPESSARCILKPARSACPFVNQIGVADVGIEGAGDRCGELFTCGSGQRSFSVELKYARRRRCGKRASRLRPLANPLARSPTAPGQRRLSLPENQGQS